MNGKIHLTLATFLVLLKSYTNGSCKDEIKCHISKVLGMIGADCYDRDFRKFPQCIRSDIEVIDLTKNRIKQLRRSDLGRYDSLKMLYLQDNFLLKIENDTFNDKTYLTTLDLANNGMSQIPQNIFHLPSLQSLYLSQNTNTNIVETMEKAAPITSPLTQCDISFSELERLPEIGILPTLVKYNVSGNYLNELNVRQFSGLCGLKYLITQNVTLSLSDPCQCWNTNRWLKAKSVDFAPFDCELNENLCQEVPFNETDLAAYDKCSTLLKEIAAKSMLKKILIPVLVGLVVICIGVVFYCRRRKKQFKKAQYGKKSLYAEHVPMDEDI